jgi:peptide/nickel transport system substrate-binding protein
LTTARSPRAAGGLLTALVLLTAAACGGGGDSPSGTDGDAAPVDAAEAADRTAELRFAINYGYNSLDPHNPVGPGDAIWMRPVYDRLLTLAEGDDGVELAPQLATSHEFSEDGLSLAFELRDDVTFQDGAAFDAEVVQANIERAQGPESTVASLLESIESVEVVDATHVTFHLSRPDPALPWTLADTTAGMMIDPAAFDTDLAVEPAGTGPFRLTSAQRDADVVYERWDDHWDPDAALVSQLTISTVQDANARYNGIRSGEYDAAFLSPPQDSQAESMGAEGYHWEQELSPISYGVLLNSSMPPFDDVDVRRAVSLALDRSEISEELLAGLNPPSYQAFNEGYLGHDPDLDEDPYDLDEAERLVRDAGADGATVNVIQALTAPQESLALVLQQALEDIGMRVELTPLSPTESSAAWREGGHHAYVGTINGRADAAQTLNLSYLGPDNPAGAPDELADMAAAALSLPVGSSEREEAYQEIGAWLQENPVHLPIAQFSTVVLARPEVVGHENLVIQDLGKLDLRGVGVEAS